MAIPAGRMAGMVKNFNVGYISLNIRGRLLIFGILGIFGREDGPRRPAPVESVVEAIAYIRGQAVC